MFGNSLGKTTHKLESAEDMSIFFLESEVSWNYREKNFIVYFCLSAISMHRNSLAGVKFHNFFHRYFYFSFGTRYVSFVTNRLVGGSSTADRLEFGVVLEGAVIVFVQQTLHQQLPLFLTLMPSLSVALYNDLQRQFPVSVALCMPNPPACIFGKCFRENTLFWPLSCKNNTPFLNLYEEEMMESLNREWFGLSPLLFWTR